MNMAVPPFPSQALAKLVLGYLAEEQLMTAYDEFLQASPYLDALENEYDRVLMTSLRSMLAEYRAVKIYVETCKPVELRRMLFQSPNLLEIVKFLIENIDINKVLCRASINSSVMKQNSRTAKRLCEGCNVSNFQNCVCNKISNDLPQSLETIPLGNSVETTSLTDLPGHQSQIERDQGETSVKSSKELSKRVSYKVTCLNLGSVDQNIGNSSQLDNGQNKVCTTGICGPDSGNISVPDSSTSENVQITSAKESNSLQSVNVGSSKVVTENVNTRYLVIDQNNTCTVNSNDHDNMSNATPHTNKGVEHKITILSDVKVDKAFSTSTKMPKILKNATSTPMLQMQTIFINGIPAYRQDKTMQPSANFTKDEIMSMPTIIVTPTSNGPSISTAPASIPTSTISQNISESPKSLGPLVIDLNPPDSNTDNIQTTDESTLSNQTTMGLVKTVDIQKKNPSVPKDNIITNPNKMKTPQLPPVARKSSSTPRRSTHVRVLDFATPRRILHEVVTENANECKAEGTAEEILSRSPNLAGVSLNALDSSVKKVDPSPQDTSSKENTKISPKRTNKKRDWDADLRALASFVTPNSEGDKLKQTKCKSKSTKKTNPTEKKSRKSDAKSGRRKSAKAVKSTDSAIVEIIDDDEPVKEDNFIISSVSVAKANDTVTATSCVIPVNTVDTIKPIINIISREDKYSMLPPENTNIKDKSAEDIHKKDGYTEDLTDTPEAERLSLQNVIGAKLNISEFLETPYKQALYDIQMDTPRFLGPDLPGDPLSDIKIMNIPTPRFLASPNPQATPSSYSSRPTDYSSGGSYYKPDDQDYIPSAELLGYPSAQKCSTESEKIQEKSQSEKSRPVRKCTKNVSYYGSRHKETEESGNNSNTSEKSNNKRTPPDNKTDKRATKLSKEKGAERSSNKKLNISKGGATKKRKTPVKKDKSFMKIKPRKCSPLKCPRSKRKSFTSPLKLSAKKKLPSKDKEILNTSLTVTAAPPKSRRKSSTPRKLQCTKQFTSESSDHDSLETESKNKYKPTPDTSFNMAQDSDTEQIALRWSDDGSQHGTCKIDQSNEAEDITKIQEFIATTYIEEGGKLHQDLIDRGFDFETAKRIERDLLDTTENNTVLENNSDKKDSENVESSSKSCQDQKNLESDCSNNLIDSKKEEEEIDEIELSVHECCEESNNYIYIQYNEEQESRITEVHKLKDRFSMEICLDDDVKVRLRATHLTILVDQNEDLHFRETQMAVSSISNFDKLYTPLKDAVRAKCSEIFDSTLTSLDTPLKATSPTRYHESTITDRLEVGGEKIELVRESVEVKEKGDAKQRGETKEKPESKKRKRAQSGVYSDDSTNSSKKTKPETQYLLNSANIQNIDIESVLKQLHGS